MLKISESGIRNDGTGQVIKVEGQAIGRSVEELRRVCSEWLGRDGNRLHRLVLDLDGLSFLDTAAIGLFRELARRNVTFTNCSVFVAEQLREMADDRR